MDPSNRPKFSRGTTRGRVRETPTPSPKLELVQPVLHSSRQQEGVSAISIMAGQSQPTFSFGNPAPSGSSGGLFGQQTSSSQQQGGLFSSSNNPTTTSGPSMFGGTSTAAAPSPFGAANTAGGQSSNLFGSGGGGASSGGGLFGGGNKPVPAFGALQQQQGGQPSGTASMFGQAPSAAAQQSGTNASIFGTPNKPTDSATTASGQSSNVFSGFQNATLAAPGSSATPASKPGGSFSFLGSTTPAGPPPPNQNNQQQETKSLFGAMAGGAASSQQPAASQNNNSASSGSIFANIGKPSGQQPASTGGSTLFGNPAGQTLSASSGQQTNPTSMFGKPGPSAAAEAQKPTFSFPSASSSQPSNQSTQNASTAHNNTSSLFNLGGQSKPTESPAPTTSAPTSSLFSNLGMSGNAGASAAPASNMFGNLGKTGDTAASAAPSSSLFGNLAKPSNTAATTAPSSTAPTSSLFSNLGKTQETPLSPSGAAATSSQPQAPTTAPTSSLFSNLAQPANSSAPSQSTAHAAATSGNANAASSSMFGASTSGPAPSAQSRLKNKSMDEIITRWASDLAKYQKEFQKQAEKVADWDRMIVENSEKIQKLYGSTLESERATAEVERQITAVENDQDELQAWLNRYEKDVDQMIANQGDPFHGPDLERERTYQLAEKLSTRLDEMGKDLVSMIEEINDASSSLNKTAKPNDPLSQVVRVLNGHLTQLQQIDQGAAALQLKVATAQKASRSFGSTNGTNGPSSEAADGFYRSFMGRR
ncbi:MAG: hypothetical protein Q9203_002737 [Teloschistes exilis]